MSRPKFLSLSYGEKMQAFVPFFSEHGIDIHPAILGDGAEEKCENLLMIIEATKPPVNVRQRVLECVCSVTETSNQKMAARYRALAFDLIQKFYI